VKWPDFLTRSKNIAKYIPMVKMVYDEYMAQVGALQTALKGYNDALLKQKPKAEAEVAKAAKVQAKSDAKAEKAAKKGK
jgi:hypothetical protein